MKNMIELGQVIKYRYSYDHKSLMYCPSQENYMTNNNEISKYEKRILKLYAYSGNDKEVHFISINPQMLEANIALTNQLIFEVTEKCNLSCEYCGYGDTYKQASERRCKNMEWQTAKTVLDFYIPIWKKERPKKFKECCFISFYGGEPLLNINLIKKIIKYLELHGEGLEFCYSMTTNGVLLPNHIKYLIEKNFILSISMDGDRKMNSYRVYANGNEVYDDLFLNLKEIQSKHKDYFEKKVEFLSVANNRNTNEGIVSFFNKEFGKPSEIHQLSSTMVANYEKYNSMRRRNKNSKKGNNSVDYLTEFIKYFSGNFYFNYRSLLDDSKKMVKTPTGTCMPFSIRTFITARNDILACERIGFEHTLGIVKNGNLEFNLENIVTFYNNKFDTFKIQCENCFIKESCDLCFLTNEKYSKERFTCEKFYSLSDLEKCISESLKTLRGKTIDYNIINNMI